VSAPLYDAASRYACLSWRVFPVYEPVAAGVCSCSAGSACANAGKHPRTPHGMHDATTAATTIAAWWTRWRRANIGVRTGDGLYVIDVDGHAGAHSLVHLEQLNGTLPRTVEVATGRGRHLYFATRVALRSTRGALGAGIDTRGDGGYIIAPPSEHASGARYAWVRAPWDTEIAALPENITTSLCAVSLACSVKSAAEVGERQPRETAQARALRFGPDESRSGDDARRTIAFVQRNLSEGEIRTAFERFSDKWREKRDCYGPRTAESYFAATLAWAKRFHARGLSRAIVQRASLQVLSAWNGKPALARVRVELVTSDGECVRARVVVPDDAHPNARAAYEAVMGDVNTATLLAPGGFVLARRLVGRVLDVAVRDGRVVWMRAVDHERDTQISAFSRAGRQRP
jgi:hypothetical protein